MSSKAETTVRLLPESPGVYTFYDRDNTLIYVGKAKNLRKRVSSYFNKQQGANRKTQKLVSEINRIEYTLAGTEFDALLLENNLIKENQPKYNILLKDDKTFPYICILHEPFPRIIYTRKYQPEKGEFFGPFSSVTAMKNVLDLLRRLYTIRTCSLLLSQPNIEQKKFRVCLEYHIGNCKGPCEGLQTEEDYMRDIEQARNVLKGRLSLVEQYFQQRMQDAADNLQFERAQYFKEKLLTLEKFQVKSLVVNRSLTDLDVISISSDDAHAYINFMIIKEGAIVYSRSMEIKKKLEEADPEIVSYAYQQMRNDAQSTSPTVLSNIPVDPLQEGLENIVPKIGDKRKLIILSLKNALQVKREKELLRGDAARKVAPAVEILQKDMRLKALPMIIECFDNSNLQGSNPVASMVRFVNGRSDKKGYRHFNIKTVVGADDFASMKEIVSRRYSRLLEEKATLPDLILIDGGKGQLSSACEALQTLGLYGKIPVAGIAKRLEEIYFPNDPIPLYINKKSAGLHLLQAVRNEAHRFAITFHRKKRSQSTIQSELEQIKGIGKNTLERLLREFKSIKKIREASLEELAGAVGQAKAKLIKGAK